MIGFDYSVKPKIMIIGDIEFPQLINNAKILGLGYISIPVSQNDCTPLKIAFIFNDEVNGKTVMNRFLEWIRLSNNNTNAFALDIIEKNDNSYLLCFYQDEKLLLERNIPKEMRAWVEPIITKVIHFKSIEKRSDLYYKFKATCEFSKCHIYGADKTGKIFILNKVIVKNNIKFYKEDDITEESHLYAFKLQDKSDVRNKIIKNKNINFQEHSINRISNIKYFFPITYNEIINCKYFNIILDELIKKFDKDIIMQAICNVVLEHRLLQENINLDKNSEMDVIEYLVNNYESPISKFPNDNKYTSEIIIEQIKRDKEYYNKILGGK